MVLPTISCNSTWPRCLVLSTPLPCISLSLRATRVLTFKRLIPAFTGKGRLRELRTSTLIVSLQPRSLLLWPGPEMHPHPGAFPIIPYTPPRMDTGWVVLQIMRPQEGRSRPSVLRVPMRVHVVLGRRQVLDKLLQSILLAKPLVRAHTNPMATSSLSLVTPISFKELTQRVTVSPPGRGVGEYLLWGRTLLDGRPHLVTASSLPLPRLEMEAYLVRSR